MNPIKRLVKRLRKIKPQLYIPPEFFPILQAVEEVRCVSDLDTVLQIDPDTMPKDLFSSIGIPKLAPSKEKAPTSAAKITKALDTFL